MMTPPSLNYNKLGVDKRLTKFSKILLDHSDVHLLTYLCDYFYHSSRVKTSCYKDSMVLRLKYLPQQAL